MTNDEYREIVDDCIYEFTTDATVQECLDAFAGAHIIVTVVDVVKEEESKTWEEMMSYTLQQLRDGIPA